MNVCLVIPQLHHLDLTHALINKYMYILVCGKFRLPLTDDMLTLGVVGARDRYANCVQLMRVHKWVTHQERIATLMWQVSNLF